MILMEVNSRPCGKPAVGHIWVNGIKLFNQSPGAFFGDKPVGMIGRDLVSFCRYGQGGAESPAD